MDVKVSVIIPIYNGEKYLEQCIDSILEQTLKEFELICVDDGSTDCTNEILEKYVMRDARVHVYHQSNQYAGVARNTGMKYAKGKYILFLDSDDFFENDMLEKMYDQIECDEADICVCNGYNYDEQNGNFVRGGYLEAKRLPERVPFSIKEEGQIIFNFTTMHLWNKMFRFAFIKEQDVKFKPHRIQEDTGFVMHALSSAKRITVVKDRLFYYRMNTGTSLTDSLSSDVFAGYLAFKEAKQELIARDVYSEKVQRSFANKALGNCMHFFRKLNSFEGYCKLYEKLVNDNGFAELDILDYGEGYYYKEKDYNNFCQMITRKDPFQFLFDFYMETKTTSDNRLRELRKWKEEAKKEKEKRLERERKIEELRSSETFRVGKAVLWLPRKILGK